MRLCLSLQIAPRAGLLRVREFTLAEIEHFVNPRDKRHPRFKNTAPLSFLLYPRAQQLGPKTPVEMNLGEAVAQVCSCRENCLLENLPGGGCDLLRKVLSLGGVL